MNSEVMPDFEGKVLVLYIRNAPRAISDGVVLNFVSFKDMGGRIFVCGRVPQFSGSEWVHNLQAGAAWEDVVHYMIFDSLDDYHSRIRKGKPPLLQRLGL